MDRQDWTEKVLPAIRRGIEAKTVDRYAEHPYLEFHVEGIQDQCSSLAIPWKKAGGRAQPTGHPYHTEYMREHLTPETRFEARS